MQNKKKVLMFVTYYPPYLSGLTLYVQRLAEGLAQRGYGVTVLTARFDKGLRKIEQLNGVNIRRLSCLIRISRGVIMPTFPIVSFLLIRQNDIINIHSPILESALIALYAKLFNKKLIITHHGDLVLPKKNFFNRVIEFCLFNFYKIAVKFSTRIVGYSLDYAKYSRYLKAAKNKFIEIYPLIKIPLPSNNLRQELGRKLQINNNKIIGYVGRFVEEKRPDNLIKALPLIIAKIPNVKLVFVGRVQMFYEKFYERCIPLCSNLKDYIVFYGEIKNPFEMAAFYSLCDVLVLPSETECFGIVQVEAMLCGTPVVATNIAGGRVPIIKTGMGELAAPNDYSNLADKIIKVLSAKEKYIVPRERIEAIFNLNNSISKYEDIFNE